MIESVRVMLLPNKKQLTQLAKTADAARYAYNWTLRLQMDYFDENGYYLSEQEARKRFTQHKKTPPSDEDLAWLKNVSNNATKQAIKDCCNAFVRLQTEQKKPGYRPYSKKKIAKATLRKKKLTRYDMHWHPKFKKKGKAQPKFYMDTEKIKCTDTHVKLEKIAKNKRTNRAKANWIRLAEPKRIPQGINYLNPRVKFDGINWWLSVGIERDVNPQKPTNEGIGIDLGIKELAVCSDGTVTHRYENINKSAKIRKLRKKQRRLQREISRKYEMNKEGERYKKTRNLMKSEKKLRKLNHRLTGLRHNHVHQVTSAITRRKPSYIVMEDLNIRGMMQNKHLSKAIQEQCWHEFSRQMKYKCNWKGIRFIKASRFYPSSKICVVCGHVKKNLKLSERIYRCDSCENEIDRDEQAAWNLKKYSAQ